MDCVELLEPLKYIVNHGVIKIHIHEHTDEYINLFDFLPILKSGTAAKDVDTKIFIMYISYNNLFVNNEIKFNHVLKDAFKNATGKSLKILNKPIITGTDFGKLIRYNVKYFRLDEKFESVFVKDKISELDIIENIYRKRKRIQKLTLRDLFICHYIQKNPYYRLYASLYNNKIYTKHDYDYVDPRRYQFEIYKYSKSLNLRTANLRNVLINNQKILEDIIIKTNWYEKQVLTIGIESLIGKSTIPDEIHKHLLSLL